MIYRSLHEHSWVHPRIAVGSGVYTAEEARALRAEGITHVLDCRRETDAWRLYTGVGIQYMNNGTNDDGQPKPAAWFERGIQFVMPALRNPKAKVLVHCFPPGTMIDAAVPFPIEDAGMVATGHDGYPHRVAGKMARNFSGDLVAIMATGALPFRCTPEHPLLVLKPYRNRSGRVYKPNWAATFDGLAAHNAAMAPQWLPAGEVVRGDFLLSPLPKRFDGEPSPADLPFYSLHKNSKKISRSLPPTPDVAWMLGLYAADGSSDQYGIHFALSLLDDVPRLERAINSLGLEAVVVRSETYQKVHAHSTSLGRSFNAWFGGSSVSKRLPAFVFEGWPADQVLAGLIEGDGSVDLDNGWTLSSTSITLALQARKLALMSGWDPTIRRYKRLSGYANASQMYQVHARSSGQHHTCRWGDYYCMPITAVSKEPYDGPVHNIEVDDVNTYLANGVVAHNCAMGINRSPGMAYAILRLLGFDPTAAAAVIKTERTVANDLYYPDAERAVSAWLPDAAVAK